MAMVRTFGREKRDLVETNLDWAVLTTRLWPGSSQRDALCGTDDASHGNHRISTSHAPPQSPDRTSSSPYARPHLAALLVFNVS